MLSNLLDKELKVMAIKILTNHLYEHRKKNSKTGKYKKVLNRSYNGIEKGSNFRMGETEA